MTSALVPASPTYGVCNPNFGLWWSHVIACSETVEHPFALVHDRQEATVVGVILVWSAVVREKSAGR